MAHIQLNTLPRKPKRSPSIAEGSAQTSKYTVQVNERITPKIETGSAVPLPSGTRELFSSQPVANHHNLLPPLDQQFNVRHSLISHPATSPPSLNVFGQLPRRVEYTESNLRGDFGNAPSQLVCEDMAVTFYDFQEPVHMRAGRLVASGPLSLASLIKSDPFLRVTLLKSRREKNELPQSAVNMKNMDRKQLVHQILINREDKGNKSDEAFQAILLENETLDEVKGATQRTDTQLFGAPRADYEAETISKVEEILPDQKLMWTLVDRFFSGALAVFIPFMTETFFRERIEEILGPRTDEPIKITRATVVRRFDFAYLAMVLVLMRLTFLGVSKTDHNTPEEEYILANPVGPNAVNAAQMCLNQFRLLRRSATPVIQCALLMRMYHKYAPEEGEGSLGGDSEVFLGMLLQMGNSIGLNRDLSHSTQLARFNRLVNVWRFAWHEIVSLDINQSLTRGTPLLVDENSFDTMLPSLRSDESNLESMDVLESAVNNFQVTDEINQMVRDILRDILNIKRPVRLGGLLVKTLRLEQYLDVNFHSIEALLNLPIDTLSESTSKIHKFKHYVELKTALYTIYFHIFDSSSSLNYALLCKLWGICMELVPLSYMMLTINNGKTNYFEEIFGPNAQLILVPSIFAPLHKISQLLNGFILRALDSKFNYPRSEKGQIIEQIMAKLKDSYTLVRDGFASLSSSYYHAWRNCKGFDFNLELISNEENNIMDKQSRTNRECIDQDLPDGLNHYKAIPKRNELYEMTQRQLEQLLDVISSKRFEEPILKWLNTRSKRTSKPARTFTDITSDVGRDSNASLTPPQGFHVNPNVLTNAEIDMLWLNMVADPPHLPRDQPDEGITFEKIVGEPFDVFGDLPFYSESLCD